MKTIVSVITFSAILSGAPLALQAQSPAHVIQTPAEAQWGPAPPFLAAGAQIAVLSGDPTKPVAYTVRLKFPAGYTIAPHSHPTDENVVIVTGGLTFGMGDKLAKGAASNKALAPGGLGHGRRARRHTELAEDVGDVAVHRVIAHEQPAGDVLIAEAVGYEAEHFHLSFGQAGRVAP